MICSKWISSKIRVTVLKVITAVMAVILVMCMSTFDGDLRVWIPLFMVSAGWITLIMYANGVTCGDCRHKNRCMERSRNYPCRSFKERTDDESNHSSAGGDRSHVYRPDVRMPGSDLQEVQQSRGRRGA